MLGDFVPAEHAIHVAQKQFEYRELTRSQLDGSRSTSYDVVCRVELHVANAKERIARWLLPPQQGADTGKQFARIEWLGQVIIGAAVEAGDSVVYGVQRGEHKDGHVVRLST